MRTLTGFQVSPGIIKPSGGPITAGEAVRLYLDTVSAPSLPEFIEGTILSPVVSSQCGCATTYNIQYDESDVSNRIIRACDVTRVEAYDCCTVNDERIDALEARVDALNIPDSPDDIGAAAASHTHAISDVTGLQTALDGKAASSHTHAISDVTGLQTALDGKAAASHTHAISDVTGLQTALDGKAASSHTHDVLKSADGTTLVKVGTDYTGSGGSKTGVEQGFNTTASGEYSHAEGGDTTASGTLSHAEGVGTTASGYGSHAEGSTTTASGIASHAEGIGTTASGYCGHAEGIGTTASGEYSHAEGNNATSSGDYSRAAGRRAKAIHEGANVETDSQDADCESTAANQKTFRFANGYRFLGGEATFETHPSSLATAAQGELATTALQEEDKVFHGIQYPVSSIGSNGSHYVESVTGRRWKKIDGVWFPISMQTPFLSVWEARKNYAVPTLTCYPDAAAAGMVPIHPSVVKFESPWNGYKYWLAYTPYGTSGANYENPSLAVSTDGYTWINHPSVVNPLAAYPGVGKYNSDTNLFFKNGTLYLNWRERWTSGGEIIKCISSADGVTWTAPVVVIDNTSAGRSTDIVAQCINVLSDGTFEMWATDTKNRTYPATPMLLKRYTAPALTGPWTYVATAVFKQSPGVGAGEIWHADVKIIDGRWLAFFSWALPASNHVGKAYFAESLDGVNFNMVSAHVVKSPYQSTLGGTYKSCFWPDYDQSGEPCVRLLLGADGTAGSNLYNATAKWGWLTPAESFVARLATAIKLWDKYSAADNFVRADGAIGNATTGQTWTMPSGTQFAIASNKLTVTGTNNNIALLDAGVSNCRVSVKFSTRGGDNANLVFRAVDNYDYWALGCSGNGLTLAKYVAGSPTYTSVGWELPADGKELLEVELNGSLIIIYCNGVERYRLTDSTGSTRTKHGVSGRVAGTSIEGFIIESI